MYPTTVSHLFTASATMVIFVVALGFLLMLAIADIDNFIQRHRRSSEESQEEDLPAVTHLNVEYREDDEVYDQFKDPRRFVGEEVFDQEAV